SLPFPPVPLPFPRVPLVPAVPFLAPGPPGFPGGLSFRSFWFLPVYPPLPQRVYVPETVRLDNLFKDMQTDHNHLVVVINEYGETAGIVTMEDILEEIVGEIWDERDEEIEEFLKIDEDTYKVVSTASIEDFREFFNIEDDEETEATTVNGWLTEISETIPEVGYTVDYQNLTITVTAADDFMTQEILVKVKPEAIIEE
ncbi:MAG: transporter associated domain-containing protein, partial [Oscillospiraceae bacterium]|nr:transporter associated domain-containing protein [Oscillospiraceae bacterium]